MAHYISYSLFDGTLLLGITVVILELSVLKRPTVYGRAAFIRYKTNAGVKAWYCGES